VDQTKPKKPKAPARTQTAFTPTLAHTILNLVESGNHLNVAARAAGVSKQLLYLWRGRAREGKEPYASFFEDVEGSIAKGEARDVVTTARAASVDTVKLTCETCGANMVASVPQVLEAIGNVEVAQKLKSSAASMALERLARRYPARWSPQVKHVVIEEQDRFIHAAEQWAERFGQKHGLSGQEVFLSLCDAFVESEGGAEDEGDPSEGPSRGPAQGSVH
jgi:transposase-like protein